MSKHLSASNINRYVVNTFPNICTKVDKPFGGSRCRFDQLPALPYAHLCACPGGAFPIELGVC